MGGQLRFSPMLLLLIILLSIQSGPTRAFTPLKELHFGALFPMEAGSGGWPGGQACLPAVQMALEDVNLDPGLLPNYALRLHHHNSKCQPGLAARQLFELLYSPPTKLILMPGCSPVTTLVAEAAPVWNLLVLSYGASSPALSNRERFPTLFRTHPSANMQNPTRVHLFQKFRWKRITILQSVEEVFESTAKDLEEQCAEKGIRAERHSFYGDPTDALKAIRRQDARIIVGLFYVTEARRVLCQAYLHGLYGRKYVWFMIGWYADTWFIPPEEEGLNCSRAQMERAAQFHFTTESIMLSKETLPAISGMTGKEFQNKLKKRISTDPQETGGWPEAPLAYDAVWALALTLNCTMGTLPPGVTIDQFNYNNTRIADKMFECMRNTKFRGVSGQVMFSDLGDRVARTQIEQMQNGKYVVLGFYDSNTQTLEWKDREKFVNGRGPPPDSTRVKQWPITVNFRLYLAGMFFMCVGIAFGTAMFLFNRRFAYRRIIIQSQPQCNSLLVLGSTVCLLSLLLMGFPTASGSNGKPWLRMPRSAGWFTIFCHARLSVLSLGFSLAYGSLFSKVWVAHKLGTIQKSRQLAGVGLNNNEEESSTTQANAPPSAPASNPWDSIRTIVTAIVSRQPVVNALRKISQHSYGNLSFGSGALRGTAAARRQSPANLPNMPIPAARFHTVTGFLCLLDLLLSLLWLAVDPMRRQLTHFPLQEPSAGLGLEDIMLMPVLELCQSQRQSLWAGHSFLPFFLAPNWLILPPALLLGYKGLLLLFGLFLVYDTRQCKFRYLNDLKSTLLSVCNVGALCLLCGPIVVFFLRTQPNPFFVFVSATVFVCTTVSMALVFVPKMLFIYRNPDITKEEQSTHLRESTASHAEQLRYQQLLKENTDLKRQIELRNIKIQECRRILEGHLLANTPKGKGTKGSVAQQLVPVILNNNNSKLALDRTIRPCTSGGGMFEFEPTTSSVEPTTTMELTTITMLEQGQEQMCSSPSTVENGERNGAMTMRKGQGGGEEDGEKNIDERPMAGADTGVCSDYEEEDEENEEEQMATDSSGSAEEDTEEILL